MRLYYRINGFSTTLSDLVLTGLSLTRFATPDKDNVAQRHILMPWTIDPYKPNQLPLHFCVNFLHNAISDYGSKSKGKPLLPQENGAKNIQHKETRQ